ARPQIFTKWVSATEILLHIMMLRFFRCRMATSATGCFWREPMMDPPGNYIETARWQVRSPVLMGQGTLPIVGPSAPELILILFLIRLPILLSSQLMASASAVSLMNRRFSTLRWRRRTSPRYTTPPRFHRSLPGRFKIPALFLRDLQRPSQFGPKAVQLWAGSGPVMASRLG